MSGFWIFIIVIASIIVICGPIYYYFTRNTVHDTMAASRSNLTALRRFGKKTNTLWAGNILISGSVGNQKYISAGIFTEHEIYLVFNLHDSFEKEKQRIDHRIHSFQKRTGVESIKPVIITKTLNKNKNYIFISSLTQRRIKKLILNNTFTTTFKYSKSELKNIIEKYK